MNAVVANLLEKDVLSLLVAFGKPFIFAMMEYYFMRKLLPNRINKYGLIALSFVYALWVNLRDPALLGTAYHLGMNIFINAFTYFIIIFLFQGKLWRKVIVWWYFDVIKTLCEAVSYVPILLYQANRGFSGEWAWIASSVESNAMLSLLYMSVFLTLFLVLCFLSLTIWRKILMQKFHPFYLLFIALPMGIRYSLARVFRPSMGDSYLVILIRFIPDLETCYYILSLYGIFICLVADIAILYYVLSYDKRAAVEAELREAKRVMELEQARYSEVEKRSEEMAKIRHDFNNQLASIVHLISVGEDGTAGEIISSLTNELNGAQNT